jgi:hypothetical protein
LNGRDPGRTAPGDGVTLGDEPGFRDEGAEADPEGVSLASETVLPDGVGEIAGVSDTGRGVAVAGSTVGRGVGRGVGLGVGRGVGAGVGGGVGAVTTICAGTVKLGLVSPVLVE